MGYKWHIFIANLDPIIGSEQGKTRPVVVISEEEINQILGSLVIRVTQPDKSCIQRVPLEVKIYALEQMFDV